MPERLPDHHRRPALRKASAISGSFWPLAALYIALVAALYLVFSLRRSGIEWPARPEYISQVVLAIFGAVGLVIGVLQRRKLSQQLPAETSNDRPLNHVLRSMTWLSALASVSVLLSVLFAFPAVLIGSVAVGSEGLRVIATRGRRRVLSKWSAVGLPIALLLLLGQCWVVVDLATVIVAREEALTRKANCLSLLKPMAAAMLAYADQEGVFPSAAEWQRFASPHVGESISPEPSCAIGYNSRLTGVRGSEVTDPSALIVLFETDGTAPGAGRPPSLPDEPRHFGGDHYVFADGHIQWLPRKRLGEDEHGNPIWAKEPYADVMWEPVLKESEAEQPPQADP